MHNRANEALVIRVGDRFFVRFSQSGRPITAAKLAGARFWASGDEHTLLVLARLIEAGRAATLVNVRTEDADGQRNP